MLQLSGDPVSVQRKKGYVCGSGKYQCRGFDFSQFFGGFRYQRSGGIEGEKISKLSENTCILRNFPVQEKNCGIG